MPTIDVDALAPTLASADFKTIDPLLFKLEEFLTLRTYLSGYALSPSDKKVWTALQSNKVALGLVRKSKFTNVTRWFTYIETVHPEVKEEATAGKAKGDKKVGANYNIGLTDTEGGVVTRFPPEPSYVALPNQPLMAAVC
jgi:glutamyl-tRNA synthetase